MGIGRGGGTDGHEIEASAAGDAVIGNLDLLILRQAIDIGCAFRGGGDIVQFPAFPQFFEARDHRQHRRDADPAADHHGVAGILHHREIILRLGDFEDLADLPFFMDVARSAPAVDRMMDGDLIITADRRIVD